MKKTLIFTFLGMCMITAFSQTDCTFTGKGAGNSNTTGDYNTFTGSMSGYKNTTGSRNTFTGRTAGYNNTTGERNTFIGMSCGYGNTTASYNTFTGNYCGYFNTTGSNNLFSGYKCGHYNSDGTENAFLGSYSGYSNTTGDYNSFMGFKSGYSNTNGERNTFIGYESGMDNNEGEWNTFIGARSGYSNFDGTNNTFAGASSGYYNSSGEYNSFFGISSGSGNTTGSKNTFVGAGCGEENAYGSKNVAIGKSAGPADMDLENTISIGYQTLVFASNQVRIGNNNITKIGGQVSWSTLSDGRFKKDVEEKVAGLEFINKLHPVSYTVDIEKLNEFMGIKETDSIHTKSTAQVAPRKQIGFVAQEVEQLIKENGYEFTGVDVPENEKDHYAIRYAEFVVPLVKAVQELSAMFEEQQKTIKKQQRIIEELSKSGVRNNDDITISNGVKLYQNTPNPFTMDTKIGMNIPESIGNAELLIMNMEGKMIKTLPVLQRGKTLVLIHGGQLEAGMYIYTIIADGEAVNSKRMILTK